MDKDEKLAELLVEVESVANYLKQQISNGSITGILYKQKITKFIDVYEDYKISIKQKH